MLGWRLHSTEEFDGAHRYRMCAPLLTACATIGPTTIPRDRFDYFAAISESWKRQMLLGLLKIDVVYGTYPAHDREIAVMTRSVLQILVDFASYIDVPESDHTEGRVYRAPRSPEQLALFPPLVTVRNGTEAPSDAYVSVRYRNSRFWIDDRNQRSKSLFNSILLLFSLTETSQQSAAPLVTIPVK